MYVIYADRNMMRSRDIRKAALHREQSGKMYRKILNVRCAPQERISSLRSKEKFYLK